jgi:hypothetical protein
MLKLKGTLGEARDEPRLRGTLAELREELLCWDIVCCLGNWVP